MKRVVCFVIVSFGVLFASCNKNEVSELSKVERINNPSICASVQDTKASLTSGTQIVWSSGDKIGVYLYDTDETFDYGAWNSGWDLTSDAGSATGNFEYSGSLDSRVKWGKAAFFPFQGTGSSFNNYYDGNIYFKLSTDYYDYTSGQILMPMIADLSGDANEQPSHIHFRHVAGSVQLNLNNVPGFADAIGLTVTGQKIVGDDWGGIAPDAASPELAASTSTSAENNAVYLHFARANNDRNFVFNFPVPTLTAPELSFKMWDNNGLVIWQKSAPAQSNNISVGDVLVMPEITINPIPQDMYLVGYINGADANKETGYAFNNTTGQYSMKFDSDSYICLSNSRGDWYMTDQYVGSGNTATLKKQAGDKLFIPAGDHTITMSYQTTTGDIDISYQ